MRSLLLLLSLTVLGVAPFMLTSALGWATALDGLSGTAAPSEIDLLMGAAYLIFRMTALLLAPIPALALLLRLVMAVAVPLTPLSRADREAQSPEASPG